MFVERSLCVKMLKIDKNMRKLRKKQKSGKRRWVPILGHQRGRRSIYGLAEGRERKSRNLEQMIGIKKAEGKKFWLRTKISREDGRVTFTNYLMKARDSYVFR